MNFAIDVNMMGNFIALFLALISFNSFAQNKVSENEFWTEINKIAPIVDVEKSPNSYQALRKIVSDLEPYLQSRLSEFKTNWPTEIFVMDTPMTNAFVVSGAKNQMNKNFVFVTTGTIERVLKQKNGYLLLYGIIAHEMSHPIDDADPNGASKKNGKYGDLNKKMNSQGIEIITDANALHMLRAQGAQPSAVLGFLETIDFGDANAVSSFIGSHPNDLIRKSAQRVL